MSLQIDKDGFPKLVKAEYKPVYEKFAETVVAQSMPDPVTRALAFISYIQKIDRGVKFDFNTVPELGMNVKLIRLFLRRNGMLYGLAVKSFDAKLHTDQNTFINALLNPAFVGICRFEDGRHRSVKTNLEDIKPTVFGGRLPRQFEKPKKLKTTLASKAQWVRLQSNPMLEMAVYLEQGKLGMLLRYSINLDQIFFYGRKESSISKLQSNIKRQIMARRIYDGL